MEVPMRTIALVAVLLGGCVWSPADQSSWQSGRAIDLEGYASAADTVIHVRAWNHRTGALVEVATADPEDEPLWEEPDMFYWERRIVLGRDYWVPPGAPCATPGMAQIRVFAGGDSQSLPTFTRAGRDCVNAEVLAGTHPAHAGYRCRTGSSVVLFDHDGVCN
jgi:hypothetical protein